MSAVQMAKAVTHWPVSRLKPYARNPRTHSPDQIAKIAARQGPDGTTEEWRPIPGWPEYQVSDVGRVRRVAPGKGTRAGRIHAQCCDRESRVVVNLSHGGRRRQYKVHRLVMLAFVGPCPAGMEVAHLNGNASDNRLSNLIYATHRENNSHKVLHGTQRRGDASPAAKLTTRQVLWVRQNRGRLSYSKMAARLGVHIQTIAGILQGRNWRHVA